MNYDLRITGNNEGNGFLEFDRLRDITQSVKEIATKALMLRIRGFSDIKPDTKLKNALSIRLQGFNGTDNKGTEMLLDCDLFKKTISHLQLNLFTPNEEILNMTPMSLVIQTFRSALIENENKDDLDKPLLKTLLKFRKNFHSNEETFFLSNRGTIPEISITRDDFRNIELLEESIPQPRKILVNGILDEMKLSKNRLGLLTERGSLNIFAKEDTVVHELVEFLGKDVTISGLAHFKPNGEVSYVEIQDFAPPGEKDFFFSKLPKSRNIEQQIIFQLKEGKKKNPLSSILGQWPGDEDDIEFNKILKDLD